MLSQLDSPNIPSVGLPLKAYSGQVFVIIKCLCQESNEPFMIRGTDQIVACGKCSKMYQITKVEYDVSIHGKNGPQVTVAHVGIIPNNPNNYMEK